MCSVEKRNSARLCDPLQCYRFFFFLEPTLDLGLEHLKSCCELPRSLSFALHAGAEARGIVPKRVFVCESVGLCVCLRKSTQFSAATFRTEQRADLFVLLATSCSMPESACGRLFAPSKEFSREVLVGSMLFSRK